MNKNGFLSQCLDSIVIDRYGAEIINKKNKETFQLEGDEETAAKTQTFLKTKYKSSVRKFFVLPLNDKEKVDLYMDPLLGCEFASGA